MSLPPPALTWLILFPSGAACECESGPRWLRDLFPLSAAGHSKVLVCAQQNWDKIEPRSGSYDGLALINSPDATIASAKQAGFTYARELAAVPSLEAARWFIPLDSPAIASAGFNLYTPAKTSAHLKRFIVRAAARMGLRFWQRDRILVASRTPPPIEQLIATLFPSQQVRLALSAGAPEPARNRKASAAAIDERGRCIAFIKIAESDIARRIQEHEAQVLGELGAWADGQSKVPRLIHAGEVDGRFVTVQTSLPGRPGPARLTDAHLRFLASLRRGPTKPASETAMVQGLPDRLGSAGAEYSDLIEILDQYRPLLQRTLIESTIVHGDFAPWNLRLHRGEILAFDWEYGELDGLPLIDQAHCMLQLGYLLHHWDVSRAVSALHQLAAAQPIGLSPDQARAIEVIYLLDQLARLFGEGYSADDEMVRWYRDVLDRVAAGSTREASPPAEPMGARSPREVLT